MEEKIPKSNWNPTENRFVCFQTLIGIQRFGNEK